MDERKLFKLKQISEMCGLDHRSLRYLEKSEKTSKVCLNRNQWERFQESRQKQWVKLEAEEALALAFAGFLHKDMRLVEATASAVLRLLEGLPLMFFEYLPRIRCLPWILFCENYAIKNIDDRISEIGFEFINLDTLRAHQPDTESAIQFSMGERKIYFQGDKILKSGNSFSVYRIGDLFFKFLKNLKLEITDLNPTILREMSTPGLNYPNRSLFDFQKEFFRFAMQDMDKVLEYLKGCGLEE